MEKKEDLKHRIDVAMGRQPADTLFVNCKVISTFTEEILDTEVALASGKIAALGYVKEAKEVVDLNGAYLSPSFIDSHIHVESSMLTPEGFAEAVVPHGTGMTISDPHEIVNVWGLDGMKYMLEASKNIPIDILYTIPSCVPATHMETAGGIITADDIKFAYELNKKTPALSEMMNYPGVYFGDDSVLDKICAAKDLGLLIDGHSPTLEKNYLNAYLNASIATDHECMGAKEAMVKLRRGMYVLMREGSAARNLKDLVSILDDKTVHRLCIASDDRHPDDLKNKGHLDYTLQCLIRYGVDPVRAIRLMTLNTATLYRLGDLGGIAPGFRANLAVIDNLENPKILSVYHNGKKVAENGALIEPLERVKPKTRVSVTLPENLEEKLGGFPESGNVRVIGIIEGQLLTENIVCDAKEVVDGDLAYLAVIERHGQNGRVGIGFVKGLGLKSGALASTVAHDSHNLIIAGKNRDDMLVAAKSIEKLEGGFVVVNNKEVKASLPLDVAGLMSTCNVNAVCNSLEKLQEATKELGITLESPFMVLSFLALPVIPHLKLTDQGLVDVDQFKMVDLKC